MSPLGALVATLRALADETRLRILHVLWRAQPSALTVGELVEILQRPQPTVSRHLATLRELGFVVAEIRGTERWYGLPDVPSPVALALRTALEGDVAATPKAQRDAARLATCLATPGRSPAA